MNNKVAIVLAAGYKGVGYALAPEVPPVCPEALMPIGVQYGGTPVARIGNQLRNHGYKVFVAVGRPGCRYTGFLKKCVKNPTSLFPPEAMKTADKPPWTMQRLHYVAVHGGIPLLMPEPDLKSYDNSAMQALDHIGFDWWDQLVIIQCDFVHSDQGIAEVLSQPAPCQVMVRGRHIITEILTPAMAKLYRKLGDKFRHREKWGWTLQMGRWGAEGLPPEGKQFKKAAPYVMIGGDHTCAPDLDVPKDYRLLKDLWLPKYG